MSLATGAAAITAAFLSPVTATAAGIAVVACIAAGRLDGRRGAGKSAADDVRARPANSDDVPMSVLRILARVSVGNISAKDKIVREQTGA